VPIRVRVLGVPGEEDLELLTRQVAAQVRSRLAAARRELPTEAAGAGRGEAHERYDPARDLEAGYELPAYQGGGRLAVVPLRESRPWLVLRAVHFRATVGEFLDVVERQRDEPLPNRVLYDDRAAEERWVGVWWVQVNQTTLLTDLEAVLVSRANELAKLSPRRVLADLISPFDSAWEDLAHLDRTGTVRARIPRPGDRNQRRVEGGGRDAVVRHGGWVLFAFMALPRVSAEDVLDLGELTPLRVPLPDAGFLVDQPGFAHRWSVGWDRFAEEFSADEVTIWLLGLRPRRRLLAQAVNYLASVVVQERRAAAHGGSGPGSPPGTEALIGMGLFVLTSGLLQELPAAVARFARPLADPPAPAGVRAGFGVPLEAGWPLLSGHVEIPLGPDRIAAALQGPSARRIAAAIRDLLGAGPESERWVWRMWDLLDEANAGGPPASRPPGGTLAEHVLAELDRTGDLVRLYDSVDATRYFGLRAWLLAISLPTRFADHPRVRRLHEELAAARAATFRNEYLPGGAGVGAVLLDRDPRRRWAVNSALGDVDGTYVIRRSKQRVKKDKTGALRAAVLKHRIAVTADVARGVLPRELDEEAFAREVLARALNEVPITKDDVEEVTVERSLWLLGVERRDLRGLPSYDLRMIFVERIEGERSWTQIGTELPAQTSGDFEATLIAWAMGGVGELWETFGIAITVVGLVLVAWEAGLIAILVEAAGGAAAVATSIIISELIYLLQVVLGHAELTLRGFLMAALDGYLMALSFRLGGLAGRFTATRIGTASLRRVIAGWVAERLVAGTLGGAVSAALEQFAHDVVAVATGEGSWSSAGTYVRKMALGAAVGVVAEFALQPALHALLAGGRTGLESAAELVSRIRAEGWSAVQFSAGVTEALGNLRASLTTLAGDAAARGFTTALAERLEIVLRELGSSAVARRVLELSGARFTREATEGLQRFLRAAEAYGSPSRATELAGIFARHPQETVHFLEALSRMEVGAARHLVTGTFGTPQELAAFLGRIGRYEPSAQRAIVRLLGELGIVAADPAASLAAEQVLQRQLALSLRLQAAGETARAAQLRREALTARQEADWREGAGNTRRAEALRREAANKEAEAEIVEARARQASATEAEVRGGGGPSPREVVPTSEELEAALNALESGTSKGGGPEAWVRIAAPQARGNAPVLERIVRSLFRSRSGNRVVFRVEGGVPPAASRNYVRVDRSGNVRLSTGGSDLNLNFGVFERAIEFLVQARPGARLKVFEVEEGWFTALRNITGPEQGAGARLLVKDPATGAVTGELTAPGVSAVEGVPRLVDTRYGVDQLQIPASVVRELEEFIVPGTGRVLEFTP
jgi:hypothetical protein